MTRATGTVWGLYDPNYSYLKINMYRWQIKSKKFSAFSETIFSRKVSAKRSLVTFCKEHRITLIDVNYDKRSNTEFIT